MGYAPLVVKAAGVKKAQTENLPMCCKFDYEIANVAETVCYQVTHDLTDVEYLYVCVKLQGDGANKSYARIYFDATLKATLERAAAGFVAQYAKIDCTGVSGDKAVKIKVYRDAGMAASHAQDICMWAGEA